MRSPPSPLGPFPASASTGGNKHHILWPAPRKTGALPGGKEVRPWGEWEAALLPQLASASPPRAAHLLVGEREMLAPLGSPLAMGRDSYLAKRPGGKRKMPRIGVQKLKMGLDFEGEMQKIQRFLLYISVPTSHGQQQLKTLMSQVLPLQTGLASCTTPQQPHGAPCTAAARGVWLQPRNFGGTNRDCIPLQGPLNRRPSQEDFSVEFHKEAHDEGSWKPQLFKH